MRDLCDPIDCPDCQVKPGQQHDVDCDVAVCLANGAQRMLHRIPADDLMALLGDIPAPVDGEPHDCGHDVWTGMRHGTELCVAAGWWVVMDSEFGWTPVPAGTTGAVLDRNRLHTHAAWSPIQHRWLELTPAGVGA